MCEAIEMFNGLTAAGDRLLERGCCKDALDKYDAALRTHGVVKPRCHHRREIYNRMAHCHLEIADKIGDEHMGDLVYHVERAGELLQLATEAHTDRAYNEPVSESARATALPPPNFEYAFMLCERQHRLERKVRLITTA